MSKQKTVNRDTVHLWVHQTQEYPKTPGGRLFFRGDTIYSYGDHFPIARHVYFPEPGEAHCILFTTRTYSVTTRHHCSEVERAIPGGVTVFHVDNVCAGENTEGLQAQNQHWHNLNDYKDRITETAGKAKRARSNKDGYLGALDSLISEHNGYIDFFQLDTQHIERHDGLVAQLVKDAEEARKRELEREKERERQAEINKQEDIQKWLSGEASYFPCKVQKVYLRNVGELETSKGACVPLEHARKVFGFVKQCRDRGEEFHCNGRSIHLGNYTLDHIDAQGNVRAGCHLIEWPQIESFAKKEGWLHTPETANVEAGKP